MKILSVINNFFSHSSLRFQFLAVIAVMLLIPVLVILYDIFFASRSEEIAISEREERLKAVIENRFMPAMQYSLNVHLGGQYFSNLGEEQRIALLRNTFNEVASPLVVDSPGVRFGLYVLENKQIFVQGFLHRYRNLSPEESEKRERRIHTEVDSGILAAVSSQRPFARLTRSLNDQTLEYLSPLRVDGEMVAVLWADERLHPIFMQTYQFRLATRYLVLIILIFSGAATLLITHNLASGVKKIKTGLHEMEEDLTRLLPEMPGEMGQLTKAVNKMAVSLAEKKKIEEELHRSERLASLGRLVTGVAHELRNPISVVKTTVQVMESEFKSIQGLDKYVNVIKEQSDRQNKVIQELLEFGRQSKPVVQPLDANILLEKVFTLTVPMLTQNKINLKVELSPELPKFLGDGERIKQVLINLILNAIEAMNEGGTIKVKTFGKGDKLCIQVSDTGKGIPCEELPIIFEPFYSTKDRGVGLGLSISHQIIQNHGGSIEVSETGPLGTTFVICLPISVEQGGFDNNDPPDHDN